MKVPLLDLQSQYAALKTELDAAVIKVCESQSFILGPEVRALEESVAAISGCTKGIGVSSGTDALLVALMAMGIGQCDEVITTPYTFFATGGTIARVGARPVFCDIDRNTFNLSADAVRAFIAANCDMSGGVLRNRQTGGCIRALMPVHLYGQLADMPAFMAIASEFNLRVIEDAAQAIGAADPHGRRAGSYGDVGCLSFFPSKNLGAFGDAGMCVTNDATLSDRLEIFRVHGSRPKYYHAFVGGNFRIDELQAAVLNVKLPHLAQWTAARQRNAAFYDKAFRDSGLGAVIFTPAPVPAGGYHIYNQYVVRCGSRDALKKYLADKGIGTEIYYPLPLHQQECFQYLNYNTGDFPQSELAATTSLALPVYPELRSEQLQYVVETVKAFYA
jgi:dTDP-4-amino-4,6-dideoxygalactose transaminase